MVASIYWGRGPMSQRYIVMTGYCICDIIWKWPRDCQHQRAGFGIITLWAVGGGFAALNRGWIFDDLLDFRVILRMDFRVRQAHVSSTTDEWNGRDEDIFVDRVAASCRSFNLRANRSHFRASDQRWISADRHRLADAFGVALKLLNSTLEHYVFFIRAFSAIARLAEVAHLHKVSCTTHPQNVGQLLLHVCTSKYCDTILYTLSN